MNSSYEEVFDEFTDKKLVSLLEDDDYENVKIVKPGLIRFSKDHMNYLINNSYDDGTVGIFMIFDDIELSFKEMNKWNSEKRFVTVYRDDDGRVCLKMDLESDMTEAYLLKSINRFIIIQKLFSLDRLGGLAKLFNMFK